MEDKEKKRLPPRDEAFKTFKERAGEANLENLRAQIQNNLSNEGGKKLEDTINFGIPDLNHQFPEYQQVRNNIREKQAEIEEKIHILRLKKEELETYDIRIQQIPVLFDIANFSSVSQHLLELSLAGIKKIKIGDKEYLISYLSDTLQKVKEYSQKVHQENLVINEKFSESISKQLGLMGVTRDKISPFSALGFRECMLKCILSHNPRIQVNLNQE